MSANPIDIIRSTFADARWAMTQATAEITRQRDRIDQLETALNRMVLAHQNTLSDSEGRWPQPDSGCIECTLGTVPDRLNTGLCAYHTAKQLLAQVS